MSVEQVMCQGCDKYTPADISTCQHCGEPLDITITHVGDLRAQLFSKLNLETVETPCVKESTSEEIEAPESKAPQSETFASDSVLSTENITVHGDEVAQQPFGLLKQKGSISLTDIDSGLQFKIKLEDVLHEITIGRPDKKTQYKPTVDLSCTDGRDKGVSRFHAIIVQYDNYLGLTDRSSKNGTFLNGIRLIPGQTRIIRDGDLIQLGDVKLRLNYS